MTLDEIKQANEERKAIRDRATKGPWVYDDDGMLRDGEGNPLFPAFAENLKKTAANKALITYARTDPAVEDIDWLVAEVERLRLQVQEQSETESRLRLAVAREIDTVAHLRTRLQEAEEEAARLRTEILEHVRNEARYALRIEELEARLEKAVWERDHKETVLQAAEALNKQLNESMTRIGEERNRYRAALEQYADEGNWIFGDDLGCPYRSDWWEARDGYDIARAALGKEHDSD